MLQEIANPESNTHREIAMSLRTSRLLLAVMLAGVSSLSAAEPKSYRLPATDLKQPIIWGAVCEVPNGPSLAYGGQDQTAEDGRGHTRIKIKDEWKDISAELRKEHPLQKFHDRAEALATRQKEIQAKARRLYLRGEPADIQATRSETDLEKPLTELGKAIEKLTENLTPDEKPSRDLVVLSQRVQAARAGEHLLNAALSGTRIRRDLLLNATKGKEPLTPAILRTFQEMQIALSSATETLGAEPAPRALSPLVYEPKSQRFVLFGGDHLDYLTNDTWVFDPEIKKWLHQHPKTAPPPRANHTLKANGDGTITLSGGYTYTSNMDYCGGQYRNLDDGEWSYDVLANTWTGKGEAGKSGERTYRTGKFHPDFYLEGPKPDALTTAVELEGGAGEYLGVDASRRSCRVSTATGAPPSSIRTAT